MTKFSFRCRESFTFLAYEFSIFKNDVSYEKKKKKKERGSYISGKNMLSNTFLPQLAFKGMFIILTKSVWSRLSLQEQI